MEACGSPENSGSRRSGDNEIWLGQKVGPQLALMQVHPPGQWQGPCGRLCFPFSSVFAVGPSPDLSAHLHQNAACSPAWLVLCSFCAMVPELNTKAAPSMAHRPAWLCFTVLVSTRAVIEAGGGRQGHPRET